MTAKNLFDWFDVKFYFFPSLISEFLERDANNENGKKKKIKHILNLPPLEVLIFNIFLTFLLLLKDLFTVLKLTTNQEFPPPSSPVYVITVFVVPRLFYRIFIIIPPFFCFTSYSSRIFSPQNVFPSLFYAKKFLTLSWKRV